jgi:hypothetical protein
VLADNSRAVTAFEAADDEVGPRDPLKMVGEDHVDRRAAECADDRDDARGKPVRHGKAEARHDFAQESRDQR